MHEYSVLLNTVFEYGVPFQTQIQKRWPESSLTLFNVYDLLLDIFDNAETQFDAPTNVTGFYNHCPETPLNCTTPAETRDDGQLCVV